MITILSVALTLLIVGVGGFILWFSFYTWKCIYVYKAIVRSPAFMFSLVLFLWVVYGFIFYYYLSLVVA